MFGFGRRCFEVIPFVLLWTMFAGCLDAQQVSIHELMTDGEFRAAGLAKLTEGELAALNQWLERFGQALVRLAASEPVPEFLAGAGETVTVRDVLGGLVVADDGQDLGRITNCFDSDSICNEFGRYGNEYSRTSIFNEFGAYGGEFSRMSPFNAFASTPPRIFKDGDFVAYLTVNTSLSPRIDPTALLAELRL